MAIATTEPTITGLGAQEGWVRTEADPARVPPGAGHYALDTEVRKRAEIPENAERPGSPAPSLTPARRFD
jgi:hypothetical protein